MAARLHELSAMCRLAKLVTVLGIISLVLSATGAPAHARVPGLLKVHPDNPRYLTNKTGKPVVLVGPHTWHVFQDYADENASVKFDYNAWLAELNRDGFNFFRGWTWEDGFYSPLPFQKRQQRGRTVFNLARWNKKYFSRLRTRVQAAEKRGLYTSVMLFQGWSVDDRNGLRRPRPWPAHPFNPDNNRRGRIIEHHSGSELEPIHEEYLRRMVDALYDLDNFVWEVGNELDQSSGIWIRKVVTKIRELEQEKRATGNSGSRKHLIWASCGGRRIPGPAYGADIVSPCNVDGYGVTVQGGCSDGKKPANPPAATGDRIVIADSDHLEPFGVDADWAWKSFLRGLHPIALVAPDETSLPWWRGGCSIASGEEITRNLRSTLKAIAEARDRIDLARALPQKAKPKAGSNGIASSGYALYTTRNPSTTTKPDGKEFLVYQPQQGSAQTPIRVCGLRAGKDYDLTWRRLDTGSVFFSATRDRVSNCATFTGSPNGGVLELKVK